MDIDFGFDTNRLLSTAVGLPTERYDNTERRSQFYRPLSDDLNRSVSLERALLGAKLADMQNDNAAFEKEGAALPAAELRPPRYARGPAHCFAVARTSRGAARPPLERKPAGIPIRL